ncbi:hypothetical protein [Adhaeribacter aquaticus]|uniref:hypothetical protein n=1 Tax=Adhaeribacter aquaticus TaxID=299567 RepID=UPI000429DBD9|nr:hypothetical protein [Adhaeribacter aquaticus]
MELQERTRQWLATPMPTGNKSTYFQELNTLYFEITGTRVTCTGCNYYPMKAKIESFVTNPIIQTQLITTMATETKYQFTKEAIANKVDKSGIVLHLESATKVIKADTINDKDVEYILNNKSLKAAYGHNFELKAGTEAAAKTSKKKEAPAPETAKPETKETEAPTE